MFPGEWLILAVKRASGLHCRGRRRRVALKDSMGLYALDENYGIETWYDYTGATDLWAGTDLQLEQSRHILASDAYVFQGVSFPKGTDVEIAGLGTFSGSLNLIPYSYLIGVTGFSVTESLGYTLRIYDKGAQTDVFYGQFAWAPTVMGIMTGAPPFAPMADIQRATPRGPYFFRDPLIVLPPGNLQIQITNSNISYPPGFMPMIQLLFMIAVPKNTTTLNTRKVTTSSDPSGLQSIGALAALTGNV